MIDTNLPLFSEAFVFQSKLSVETLSTEAIVSSVSLKNVSSFTPITLIGNLFGYAKLSNAFLPPTRENLDERRFLFTTDSDIC